MIYSIENAKLKLSLDTDLEAGKRITSIGEYKV